MEEKRKDKRIPINAIVMYRIEDYENIDDRNIENYEKIDDQNLVKIDRLISADISSGGLQIVAKQKLPVGVYLKIVLTIFVSYSNPMVSISEQNALKSQIN